MADDAGGSGEIDILISADLCWLLVDREFKKIQDSGLVTIRSKFGWLVSRPVSRVGSEVGFIKRCLSTTLCLQIFSEAECKLNGRLENFGIYILQRFVMMSLLILRSMRAKLRLR